MSLYLGVDFASVDENKKIDWAAARKAGVRFAILRGAFSKWADFTFEAEARRAQEHGIITGAYLFPMFGEGQPPLRDQIAVFRKAVGIRTGVGTMPPVLDVEFPRGVAATGRTRTQLVKDVLGAAADMHTDFGVPPMIYTSARVWDGQDEDSLNADAVPLDQSAIRHCPLWLARYPYAYRKPAVGDDAAEKKVVENLPLPPIPKLWGAGNVWIHQYQGDAKAFPGIAQCDLNRFFDLRLGAIGPRVTWAQERLGMAEGNPGVFDNIMHAAVRGYQDGYGMTIDGIIGPQTFSYLAWED